MKLWVDDLRPAPTGWHWAKTVTEAIRILDTTSITAITEISLDHDISHAVVVNGLARPYPCGETFEPVARFLAAQAPKWKALSPQIIIHTANPIGAQAMRLILEQAGLLSTVSMRKPSNGLEAGREQSNEKQGGK